MVLDPWDVLGDAETTEHWRSVIPALSTDAASDRTGAGNDRRRVASVRQRYALELKHLTRTERGRGFVTSRLTRISDWSPLTDEERRVTRAESPFVLCRGIPSGLRGDTKLRSDESHDFAILVSVAPPFLPAGALLLDGVPLVIHRSGASRPLPSNADELWPREPAVPSYPG
jgi:hypothetical protein